MGYRRSSDDITAQQRWKRFRAQHRDLIARTTLTGVIMDREDTWHDFLEHGYLDHHDDPTRTNVEQLDDDAYQALVQVVELYLADTGFRVSLVALRPDDRLALDRPHVR